MSLLASTRVWIPLLLLGALFTALVGCEDTPKSGQEAVVGTATDAPDAPPAKTPARTAKKGTPVSGDAIQVPYILWGGDMATFYGNGGLRTTEGSVFADNGLVLNLTAGDDFDQQVADYKAGKSPFLRGTLRMIGLATEQVGTDPGNRPMVFMQMTWSAGDHMVARESIGQLSDLAGKKVAVQKGGPHVGMLADVLETNGLAWNSVTVVWADAITGPGSAAEMFRSDPSIDAAFAVTPDMIGLTGGLESKGSGAEGTVKGARVAVSTAELSRSIADVYAVRADFWRSNPDVVNKFAAAYLESVEQVVDLKNAYEGSGSEPYLDLLAMSQEIYGKDALPTLEEDAHGLLSDCTFVGHPGNVAFFGDETSQTGFAAFNRRAVGLAVTLGTASSALDLLPSPINWNSPEIKARLKKTNATRGQRFNGEAALSEIEAMDADGVLDDRTLISFTISFQPNQTEFDARQYEREYKRVLELAQRYGNAVVAIRGHSDTTLVLRDAVKAGIANGKLQRSGTTGNYQYFLEGKPLDLNDSKAMSEAIARSGAFAPVDGYDPRKTMQAALNLSRDRSNAVRDSMIQYAKGNGVRFDESQLQVQGVGVREPLVARPRDSAEAAVNMRVEFRLVRVSAEAMTASDFDF